MYGKYSLDNMLKICKENNELICAYLKGQSFEGYDDKSIKNLISSIN